MPQSRNRRDELDVRDVEPLVNAFVGLNPRVRIAVVVVLLVVGAAALGVYWKARHAPQATPGGGPGSAGSTAESVDLLLGNPSAARADESNRDNFLMVKKFYALSYNDSKGTPNWVSWRVTKDDLGTAPRKPFFDPDADLPAAFMHITHKDYSRSGFDRGHMCPHSDRAATQEMSYATFIMTNIIPQGPNVNRKAWAQLEMYCREQVGQHNRLYIVAGPAGQGGRGSSGSADSLEGGKVVVPAMCWKVIVIVPEAGGSDDVAKISPATRVISVIMPNDNDAVGEEWAGFRTSVSAVEAKTGLHFFDRVPPTIASALKSKVDSVQIAAPVPMIHTGD